MIQPEDNKKHQRQAAGKITTAVFLLIGVAALALAAAHFIRHRMAYAVTDAVFVRTDSLTSLGFNRVNGRLSKLDKKAGDTIHKGEVLAVIDSDVYRLKVQRLAAQLAEAEHEMGSRRIFLARLRKEVRLNEAIAKGKVEELSRQAAALRARGAAVQALILQLTRDRNRYKALYRAEAVSTQKAEDIATQLAAKEEEKKSLHEQGAALKESIKTARDQVKLAKARRTRVGETARDIEALQEKVKALKAALAAAGDDLAECRLKSPLNGRVAKRFFSAGSVISPGKVVFSVVDPRDIYIIALLEENKLAGVKSGAEVNVSIDAYPDQKFKGEVEKIMPASAATFALAPRDISAGEFTKVAQRIPVRIKITHGDTSLLRVGLGGAVEIKRQ